MFNMVNIVNIIWHSLLKCLELLIRIQPDNGNEYNQDLA